jgi:hypothetical protein
MELNKLKFILGLDLNHVIRDSFNYAKSDHSAMTATLKFKT